MPAASKRVIRKSDPKGSDRRTSAQTPARLRPPRRRRTGWPIVSAPTATQQATCAVHVSCTLGHDDDRSARHRSRRPHRRHGGRDRPARRAIATRRPTGCTRWSATTSPSTGRARRAASGCGRCSACSPTRRSPATTGARCPARRRSNSATTSASSTTTSRTATASAAIGRRCGRSTASRRRSTPATCCSACRASRSTA